ncbi:MAG: PD-(D/E)XK nuclease-like domain-containing protein [Planctomycetota bacterium]
MKAIPDTDVLIQEPFEVYLEKAAEHLSSHQLKEFRDNPYLYHKRKLGLIPPEPDRPAFLFGRAAHTLILEGPNAFDAGYAVGGPVNPRTGEPYGPRTKAFAEWAEEQGKPVLTGSQADLIDALYAAVWSHEQARALLSDGVAEGVVRADYRDVPCQVRIDWLNPTGGIADLKTCDTLTYFEMSARNYGYIHQMAFYRAVLGQVTGNLAEIPVHIIAVEKQEPNRCGAWRLAPDLLKHAQKENEQAIERLKRCEETGTWPTGYESVRTFDYL